MNFLQKHENSMRNIENRVFRQNFFYVGIKYELKEVLKKRQFYSIIYK